MLYVACDGVSRTGIATYKLSEELFTRGGKAVGLVGSDELCNEVLF